MNKELGCRKELTPYTLCGDIGFNNKILLCKDCETSIKTHNEFMKEVEDANSLPAQTCRALGPESDEDISMYAEEKE